MSRRLPAGPWRASLAAMTPAFALALLVFGAEPTIVHEERSPYVKVLVVDEGDLRYLRFDQIDAANQSTIDKRDPRAVPMKYIRVASAGLAFTPGRARALVIGVGGGTFPMLLRRSVPDMAIDAVDIDPVVISVAKRFFGVVPDEKLHLIVKDGAAFVKDAAPDSYDVVLLDAYGSDGIPEALATPAFFARVAELVAPNGVVVLNIARQKKDAEVMRDFARTFGACTLLRGKDSGNTILAATRGKGPTRLFLESELRRVSAKDHLPYDLREQIETIDACPR